jgi:hypothetical protein
MARTKQILANVARQHYRIFHGIPFNVDVDEAIRQSSAGWAGWEMYTLVDSSSTE